MVDELMRREACWAALMLSESGWLAQDGNAGLVKQALAARQMRQTQRLTQTYLTLSLADIARQIGLASPQQAEQHILRCGTCLWHMAPAAERSPRRNPCRCIAQCEY